MEVFRKDSFEAAGLPGQFVQLNHSRSARHVVRGPDRRESARETGLG